MLLNRENKENRQVVLTIQVERDPWEKALNEAYEQSKNLFKKEDGSLPTRQEREEKHGADVFYQDAVNSTFPVALVEAVRQEDISVAGAPELSVESIGPDGYVFTALIDLYPEVKLGQYKGLSAPRPTVELSDDDVTAAIEKYLQNHLAEEHPKKAAMGDEVVLDFEGFVNGVPFEGGKAEQYPLLLGSGYFIPGFEEQVAGMAVGDERDIAVTFPAQYAPELAGKDAVFHIKVHKITRRVKPVMDDAFAKAQGFADASALRRSIMEQAVRAKQQEATDAYADALVQQVIAGMEVDIPERMVTCQLDGLMRDLEQQLMQQGATMDAYLEMAGITRDDLRRQAESSARAAVEFELAMTEIARRENIQFTDAELEEKYTQMSALYGMTPDQLKQSLPIERLTHDLRLARARAIIVDSAKQI
ncbi:MAG: trigger factor [Clostridiales bacterium]|nr:trigger factor [Clostridiales bacterium]